MPPAGRTMLPPETAAMPRLAFAAVLLGLVLVLAVVALLLTDGLTPGRVAPVAAAICAALGGGLMVLGLAGIERGREGAGGLGASAARHRPGLASHRRSGRSLWP